MNARSVRAAVPSLLLALALSSVFVFGNDRGHFYRRGHHDSLSSKTLAVAANLAPEQRFLMFENRRLNPRGETSPTVYNRFPAGGYALVKLATLPFADDLSAAIHAARVLMLLAFSAAAFLAYLAVARMTGCRRVGCAAVLLAFSSPYCLFYNDMIANEVALGLFGVALTFHGMVVFVQDGRFRQLLLKTLAALALDWRVFGLLLAFVALGALRDAIRAGDGTGEGRAACRGASGAGGRRLVSLARSRFVTLGAAALTFGVAILAWNFANEYRALNGEVAFTRLPSFESMRVRTGFEPVPGQHGGPPGAPQEDWQARMLDDWPTWMITAGIQLYRIGYSSVPFLGSGMTPAAVPGDLPAALAGAAGGAAVLGVCLIGLRFARDSGHRLLLAAALASNFVWGLLIMRQFARFHEFDAVFSVGVPLAFFALLSSLVLRAAGRRAVAGLAVAGGAVFVLSAQQMSGIGHGPEAARFQREMAADFDAIRRLTANVVAAGSPRPAGRQNVILIPFGERDEVLGPNVRRGVWFAGAPHALDFYLYDRIISRRRGGIDVDGDHDFAVMRQRVETDALLTPRNRRMFLYDARRLDGVWRALHDRIAARPPAARAYFDLHVEDGVLYYLRSDCGPDDTAPPFFVDASRASGNAAEVTHGPSGPAGYVFDFELHGVAVDDRCLVAVRLPEYGVTRVAAGQIDRGDGSSRLWIAEVPLPGRLR